MIAATDVPRRKLGRSTLRVSVWCLGCNLFGWTADERQANDVLDAYVSAGGNFIDTSDTYPPVTYGEASEEIIGRWLKSRGNRDAIVLATKVGGPRLDEPVDLSAESIRRRVQASLRRLQVDRVDLLYAHIDDRTTPLEETLQAFDQLVRAGDVGYIAASNYTAPRLAAALAASRKDGLVEYVALQTHYNLLERTEIMGDRASLAEPYEGPLSDLCLSEEIGVVPYWVLAKGFLTGKYRASHPHDEGPEYSERATVHRPREYLDERGARVLESLDAVAAVRDTTVAAVAVAWTLAQPGVVSAVASARTRDQVNQLSHAYALKLSAAERSRLALASS